MGFNLKTLQVFFRMRLNDGSVYTMGLRQKKSRELYCSRRLKWIVEV